MTCRNCGHTEDWHLLGTEGSLCYHRDCPCEDYEPEVRVGLEGLVVLPGICRICGCTEDDACVHGDPAGPCRWVEPGLCSACAEDLEASA